METTDEHGWTQMGMKEIQNLKRTTDNGQSGQDKESGLPSLTPESCQSCLGIFRVYSRSFAVRNDWEPRMDTDGHRKLCDLGGLGVRSSSAFKPLRPGNSNSVNPVNPVNPV
jgi:hypothetical protein